MHKITIVLFSFLFWLSAGAQPKSSYRQGYYYNTSGQKKSGLISFEASENCIHFKPDKDSRSEKIKIDSIKSLVMANLKPDSLTVLTEDNKEGKKYFARLLLASSASNLYYKYYETGGSSFANVSYIPSPNSTTSTQTRVSYSNSPGYSGVSIMYQDGNTTHELTKKNYVEVLTKVFADDPELLKEIQSTDAKFKNVHDMLNNYRWRHR
jgi:hypothetical protein